MNNGLKLGGLRNLGMGTGLEDRWGGGNGTNRKRREPVDWTGMDWSTNRGEVRVKWAMGLKLGEVRNKGQGRLGLGDPCGCRGNGTATECIKLVLDC